MASQRRRFAVNFIKNSRNMIKFDKKNNKSANDKYFMRASRLDELLFHPQNAKKIVSHETNR